MDICSFQHDGHVLLVGDLNACIGDMQAQPIMSNELDKSEKIQSDPMWERTSSDPKVNAHARALCSVMNGLHMLVLNKMKCFQKFDTATCFSLVGAVVS